jgi:hypothetical protein
MCRPRSLSLQSESLRDSNKLEAVPEVPTFLVTHYVPQSAMDHDERLCTRQILEESSADSPVREPARLSRVLCAVCSDCCPDCAEYGPAARLRNLAMEAQNLFNQFLEPVADDESWHTVELEVTRREPAALILVSTCRQHTLELWLFHNMDSCCLGFVYRGPTDFIVRPRCVR